MFKAIKWLMGYDNEEDDNRNNIEDNKEDLEQGLLSPEEKKDDNPILLRFDNNPDDLV